MLAPRWTACKAVATGMLRQIWQLAAAMALLCGLASTSAWGQSVATGSGIYNTSGAGGYARCVNCHSGATSSAAHLLASNAYTYLHTELSPGGNMYINYGGTPALPSQSDIMSLALYIGQFKAPAFTVANGNGSLAIAVRSGAAATKDIYPLLTQGTAGAAQDSGGLNITSAASHGSASMSAPVGATTTMVYNANYTSTAGYTGSDAFNVEVLNPTGNDTRTIQVTVLGITSAATATGFKGQVYTAGSPLYQITSNDGSASNFTATGLPTGLSVDSTNGKITGTATATGSFSVTIGAQINGSINDGTVSKTLTMDIAGITNSATANYTQNSAISTFQITTYPASPSAYGLTGSLPSGLSFASGSGQISGTPTIAGSYPVTLQATTTAGAVSQALTINVASAGVPVITSTPSLATAPTVTVAGTVGTAIAGYQINATNPPITASSYAASNLPPGLAVNTSTGAITGTPTTSGDYAVTLSADNASGTGSLNVVMRIHATAAPVINSGAAGSGTVGSAGTAYTITTTGTNGPITSYSVVSGSLPAGLTLNTSTGVVSGTPTTSGVSTVTLGAVNSGGVTGSLAVTFTITPNAVPVISSPSNGTTTALALGAAMSPITITASNPPLTAFALASGTLPTGVSLNTGTGVISGTPTVPSASSAVTLTATNAVGTSAAVTVNFSVGVPTPAACTLTTAANTAASLNLNACMFPALSPTGMSASMQPAHGTLTISGVTATYTPAANFFGTDSFSAIAHFTGGATSTAGIVTVTVTGRPDPTQDKAVVGTLTAQNEAALRFSRTQISNYGRHMEGLRGRGPGLGSGQPAARFGEATVTAPSAARTSAQLNSLGTNSATQLPLGTAPASLPVASAVNLAANDMGLSQNPLYGLVTGLVQNQSVDLGRLSNSLGGNTNTGSTALPGPKVWVEGVVSFGARDASGGLSGSDFTSNGVSMGVDLAWDDKLTVGMGVGYAQDTTNIGTDGTRNESRGYSLAIYASRQVGTRGFLEGMLGVGSVDFDSKRYVSAASAFANANRKGYQLFGSVGGGLEFRDKANMISPYGRLDFSMDQLNEATETGAGTFALNYYTQTNTALQGVLGLRGESIHSTPFGWAIPRARVELRQDLQNKSEAAISYADQIGGTRYSIAPSGSLQSAMVFGIGSEFLFRDGWAFGVDYQLTQVSAQESSYALRLKLVKELGAKGLPDLLKGVELDFNDDNQIQVDAGYTWDDNITRSKLATDIRGDGIYAFNAGQTRAISLSGTSRLLLTGSVGGERFQTYNGLSNISLTGEAVYQYRASSEFDEPTFGLFSRVTALKHQSSLRDGYRYSVGASVMQPLTDRINLFGALGYNGRYANSTVFQTADTSLRVNLDYALRGSATLYMSAEYRDGDIVSTGRSSLENVTVAKVLVQDDAYAGGQFFSYRFGGTTVLTTLGYNIGLGARDSIDIAWRRVESTPGMRPAWATSPNSYVTNQVSASYLMRF
ncbi:uncharacterized protein YhjY with autotransporter beta-barrel domain [Rhodoferax saidenbachensis]|uniref:Uncharacterized protein YhjY with autotransporter beta-barrel domain n=2 Tax=Rhodoferax saidenbachensis TaxID=1484693 RepID=A0ABU1ZN10_9BURK|nr:uncharacterized protein YhjY with autotransporter beta-barrel domain [Rhodoferax saidenbachensis]